MGSILLSFFVFVAYFFASVTSIHTTKYEIGPGVKMRDYAYAGTGSGSNPSLAHKPSSTAWVGAIPVLMDLTGTGSATVTSTGPDGTAGDKYAAGCIANPFRPMGTGTGTTYFNTGSSSLLTLLYKNVKNPNAAAGDIGFVHNCENGTGSSIIANTCTSTGCTNAFVLSATNSNWNGYDFIKFGLSKDPTPSFRGKIYLQAVGLGSNK